MSGYMRGHIRLTMDYHRRSTGPGLGGGLFGPLVDYDDDDDAPESPPRSSTSSVDAGSVSSSGELGFWGVDGAAGLPCFCSARAFGPMPCLSV
jgi:hypothetical protein